MTTPSSTEPDTHDSFEGVARSLREEFADIEPETIDSFLHYSIDQLSAKATMHQFLPLLAGRFTRQQLQALAKIEGLGEQGRPIALFLCTHNAGRSQMALGFFTHYAGDRALAWSGGSEPGDEVNPAAIEAMRERGIDISGEYPKPWTDEIVRAADVVVTMGCGDTCPYFPGKRYDDWELTDPHGLDVDAVRPVRDEIERRVLRLLDELSVPVGRHVDRARIRPGDGYLPY